MEDAKTLLKNSGYQGMLLLPQNEPLRQMYEKMGFHTCSFVTEFSCEPGEKPADLRIVDQVEYARLRRKLLPEDGVVQEGAMLDLLNSQAVFLAGTDYLAVGYVDADTLRCQELLGNARRAPEILRAMGCAQGVFRCPGGEKAFAMLCLLTEDCPERIYFGLPLD